MRVPYNFYWLFKSCGATENMFVLLGFYKSCLGSVFSLSGKFVFVR